MRTARSVFSERSRKVGCFLHSSWYTCASTVNSPEQQQPRAYIGLARRHVYMQASSGSTLGANPGCCCKKRVRTDGHPAAANKGVRLPGEHTFM